MLTAPELSPSGRLERVRRVMRRARRRSAAAALLLLAVLATAGCGAARSGNSFGAVSVSGRSRIETHLAATIQGTPTAAAGSSDAAAAMLAAAIASLPNGVPADQCSQDVVAGSDRSCVQISDSISLDRGIGSVGVNAEGGGGGFILVLGQDAAGQWRPLLGLQNTVYEPLKLPSQASVCGLGFGAAIYAAADPASPVVARLNNGDSLTVEQFVLTVPQALLPDLTQISGRGWYRISAPSDGWVDSRLISSMEAATVPYPGAAVPNCVVHDVQLSFDYSEALLEAAAQDFGVQPSTACPITSASFQGCAHVGLVGTNLSNSGAVRGLAEVSVVDAAGQTTETAAMGLTAGDEWGVWLTGEGIGKEPLLLPAEASVCAGGDGLNLHSAPDDGASIIQMLADGTQVRAEQFVLTARAQPDPSGAGQPGSGWYHVSAPADGWLGGAFVCGAG